MTRSEARLVAEELYKLMRKDVNVLVSQMVANETDEWLSTEQAASMMGVSVSYIKQNGIPHSKVGRLNKYRKSDIQKLMNR